ncbi:DUF4326 domain-containing protein [Sphaerisporangium sp. NPDC051011]|uniref:DUF4326 domain-containing protein n=1 Tax=Sphaerisporangium sp. NPDC051011 TaxID=3155792 RepID=UPI00340EFBC7
MPERIQLAEGQCLPEGAVFVDVPSKWASPIRITPEPGGRHVPVMYRVHGSPMNRNGGPAYALIETARYFAVKFFEWDLRNKRYGEAYPSLDDIRRELAGRDLACGCALPEPRQPDLCHGQVLMEIAAEVSC